jgi:hypothetical protein
MQVELAQLSMEGLALDLPPHVHETGVSLPERKAIVREAQGLRGNLSTDDGGFELKNVAASELVLAALDWHFGVKTFVASERPVKVGGLRAQVASGEDHFDLDVELSSLQAERLLLTAGALKLAAETDALSLKVAVHGDDVGTLTAEQALFRDVELRTGDLVLTMPELRVRKLNVDWGGEKFKLEASTVEGEQLTVTIQGSVITANDVALAALGMHGEDYRLGEGRFGKLAVDAQLATDGQRAPSQEAAPATKSGPPLFDYGVLDGLSGHLNVDAYLDIALPIIQHRRATHELRIPIEDGSIDYRKLESNLAPLEDSLIDFSVRDDALMLELGLPLIRTRGRGKPIVRWDLSPEDLELAKERRVRLAVLPNVRPANGASEPPREKREEDDKESSVRLRTLSLENIDAVLKLAPERAPNAALRELAFEELQLSGGVHHDLEGEPREGTVRGSLKQLHTLLRGVPVGDSALRGELNLAVLRELLVRFVGLKPQRVRAQLEALQLKDVLLAPAQPGSPVTSAIANPS